jgi:hypothetical protein
MVEILVAEVKERNAEGKGERKSQLPAAPYRFDRYRFHLVKDGRDRKERGKQGWQGKGEKMQSKKKKKKKTTTTKKMKMKKGEERQREKEVISAIHFLHFPPSPHSTLLPSFFPHLPSFLP